MEIHYATMLYTIKLSTSVKILTKYPNSGNTRVKNKLEWYPSLYILYIDIEQGSVRHNNNVVKYSSAASR